MLLNGNDEELRPVGNHETRQQTPRDGKRHIRPQACVPCRQSKIRCIAVEGRAACQACLRASRQCVMPGPAKPRTRTAHRINDLERKIESLTNALLSKHQDDPDVTQKLASIGSATNDGPNSSVSSIIETPDHQGPACSSISSSPEKRPKRPPYVGLVERGVLPLEMASVLFNHWRHNMSIYMSSVTLTEPMEEENVRTTCPLTYLAITTVASASIQPSVLPKLLPELNQQFAEQVFLSGLKSLDLVQALLIYTTHFVAPLGSEKSPYTQYAHAAVSVSLDLGLDKSMRLGLSDKCAAENPGLGRAWLLCYLTTSNVTTFFRHTPLIRFTKQLNKCERDISTSTMNLGDMRLCQFTKLQRIMEEASIVFELDSSESDVTFDDVKTKFQLGVFEQQLREWRTTAPREIDDALLDFLNACATLYTNEIAIRTYEAKHHSGETNNLVVNVAHFDALKKCLEATHAVIHLYCSFPILTARCLPFHYLLWTVYAAVMLIKLSHFLHNSSGIVQQPEESTSHLLDVMINQLDQICKDNHSPPAREFCGVFKRLKMWFSYKKAVCEHGDLACHLVGRLSITRAAQNGAIDKNAHENDGQSATYMSALGVGASENAVPFGSQTAYGNVEAYENIMWDDFAFENLDLDAFDVHMQDGSWMAYLHDQPFLPRGVQVDNA